MWKRTSSRSVKVYTLPSLVQPVASSAVGCMLSSRSTTLSNTSLSRLLMSRALLVKGLKPTPLTATMAMRRSAS